VNPLERKEENMSVTRNSWKIGSVGNTLITYAGGIISHANMSGKAN
jgi:hypothetical protein